MTASRIGILSFVLDNAENMRRSQDVPPNLAAARLSGCEPILSFA
jgi:hypothetical protein